MDLIPHSAAPQSNRINSWLVSTTGPSLPPSPPPDEAALKPKKRKRAMSLPTIEPLHSSHRSCSPKRQRTEYSDNILPEQSASQISSNTPLALHEKNTFSPPASRLSSNSKRSPSPTRETAIILRSASPPVIIESLNGLKEAPPKHVERLGDRLADSVDFGFIPKGLEQVIKGDPEVGYQTIKPADFDSGDGRSVEELKTLWESVKSIFLDARDCKDGNRDENAWCDDVVLPLVRLAIRSYRKGR